MKRARVTIFNEFPAQESDRMAADLALELQRRLPDYQIVSVNGLLKKYRPGGLRPSRVLNWIYLHLRGAWEALWHAPDALIVVSSPPLIQITIALLGRVRGVRVVSWLMDYHPEMEARMAEERSSKLRSAARALRWLDHAAMRGTHFVVTLDPAMEGLVRHNGFSGPIVVHPTWAPASVRALSEVAPDELGKPLRLIFVGNLGRSHSLEAFEGLLALLPPGVELLALGASALGLRDFEALAKRNGISFEGHGRLPFDEFTRRIAEFKPNYGLVFMHARSGGVVSPSKFVTYLQQGIPLLYVGPEGSNAWLACAKFNAGVAIDPNEGEAAARRGAERLTNQQDYTSSRKGARDALAFFNSHDAKTLADQLMLELWAAKPEAGQRSGNVKR